MKSWIIVQARMGSSRLPNKIMMDLSGKTVLQHVIERLKMCKEAYGIIIATTTKGQDDLVFDAAVKYGAKAYRGSEENVLERYYNAAKMYNADTVIRITSDCPLIDPKLTDEMIRCFKQNNYEMVSNTGEVRTYPRGLDTEVFKFSLLENAFSNADKQYQKEHVTPFMYENSDVFYFKNSKDCSKYRLTLDTVEDYKFISAIYSGLYNDKHDFFMDDIIAFIEKHPELKEINSAVQQKPVKV